MDGHIFIDGDITPDYHLEVKRQLNAFSDRDTIVVHIQSRGGSVAAGYNIYNILKSSGKKIKTIVEGQAASMATFIALAADKGMAFIQRPSTYMIHNPSQGLEGDAEGLQSAADELKKIEDEMAFAYFSRNQQAHKNDPSVISLTLEDVKEMMRKETTMNPEDVVRYGFADRVNDQLKAAAYMTNEKEVKSLLEKLETGFDNFFKKFAPKSEASAMDLAGADGKIFTVDSDNGDLVGKSVTINGQAAPDGEHALADGRILVVAGGVVAEIKEPMTPEQQELQDLRAKVSALEAEKAAAISAQTAAQETVKEVTNAMETLKGEVVALKKLTVGDPNPPSKGKSQQPKAGKTNWESAAMSELFEESGISNLLKLKNN